MLNQFISGGVHADIESDAANVTTQPAAEEDEDQRVPLQW